MATRRKAGSHFDPTSAPYQRPQAGSGYIPATPSHRASHASRRPPSTPRRSRRIVPIVVVAALVVVLVAVGCFIFLPKNTAVQPDELAKTYFSLVEEGRYDELYPLLSKESQVRITQDDFVSRYENIYSGIEAENIEVTIGEVSDSKGSATSGSGSAKQADKLVEYSIGMDTVAGPVSFGGKAKYVVDADDEYRLEWSPDMLIPGLTWSSKVRVNTVEATRGSILDRNGQMLAGLGTAATVGFVPGAMQKNEGTDTSSDSAAVYNEEDIARAAELLGMTPEDIHDKLNASYVRDDSFVLLKVLSEEEAALADELLAIPGIQMGETSVRSYPLAEKASHLIGYVQNISAEELENLRDQGYNENSVIGKTGLEKTYESDLKETDGCEILILDQDGNTLSTVAKIDKADGKDITLTIDANIQSQLYDLFMEDKSCSVAMNPKTGEVLALVSTPTYDANDFITGISTQKWDALNEDANQPLYNRFQATLCPGSTMKPLTAAIALDTGAVSASDDLGKSGLSWQKDESWGDYYVTTTMEYSGAANIENALKFSDNIFFAKAALAMGADAFAAGLEGAGFDETIPFEYGLYSSSISDTGSFDSEIQLADSGYGQGQILINPVHLAAVYASFMNDGSILEPYLLKKDDAAPTMWKEGAFTAETAQTIRGDLIQVIESGSATEAQVPGRTLGGKTGTAEIKQTVDDVTGTELGWFACFTADENDPGQLLVVSMVEDVKNRNGSHYVSAKVRELFL